MNEAEFLNKLRLQAERDSYFYSNKGRAEREIWAVSEFLNGIGARHSKEELICQQQDSKIDVRYSECSFQLKEITDPDERRGKYYKDTCNMPVSYTHLTLPTTPYV